MNWRKCDFNDLVVLIGLVLVPLGVAAWSIPAALVTLGVELIGLGLLFGLAKKPTTP